MLPPAAQILQIHMEAFVYLCSHELDIRYATTIIVCPCIAKRWKSSSQAISMAPSTSSREAPRSWTLHWPPCT